MGGLFDPLSVATAAGAIYEVPIGSITREAFDDTSERLVPTTTKDPAVQTCTISVRLISFKLHFEGSKKDRSADCQVAYEIEFMDSKNRRVLKRRMTGNGQSAFDGQTVPAAVWIATYHASADWLAAAKDSDEVAVALGAIPDRWSLEADARVVSVSSGGDLAHAGATGSSLTDLRSVALKLARDLLDHWEPSTETRTAVVAFSERGSVAREEELGARFAEMLTTALGEQNRNLKIIEREQLLKLLAERDLTDADLVTQTDRFYAAMSFSRRRSTGFS